MKFCLVGGIFCGFLGAITLAGAALPFDARMI